jgi:apolipoprotein N-acyltransferase
LALPLGALLLVLAFGFLEIRGTELRKAGTVALLQPSIDQDVKWSKEYTGITFKKLSHLVDSLKDFKPELVVWPETAAPSYLLSTAVDLQRVVKIIRKSKTTHLVGCLDMQWESRRRCNYYNAAISFNPMGKPLGIYHKRHLVPFGEFVPFQKYISFLGPVVGELGNFDAGTGYEKFQARGFSYTPMICYEVIFPGDVFHAFQTKAEALVNISNDAWYGRTASAYQHAMMAVVRAAEEHKPLLRAANTGICLVTDPFGRILAHTQLFEETCLTADVVMTSNPKPTLYALWGNWFPHLCWVLTGLMVFWVWLRPRSLTHPNLEGYL